VLSFSAHSFLGVYPRKEPKESQMVKAAIILGVLVIIAAALAAGRYSLTQQGNMAFVVDRYTGAG
jgi:hypothetical protein